MNNIATDHAVPAQYVTSTGIESATARIPFCGVVLSTIEASPGVHTLATTTAPGDTSGSASFAIAVTPDDSAGLASNSRGLYIGTGGDVTVQPAGAETTPVTFKNVPSGTFMPICVTIVKATGTTASDIVALW